MSLCSGNTAKYISVDDNFLCLNNLIIEYEVTSLSKNTNDSIILVKLFETIDFFIN